MANENNVEVISGRWVAVATLAGNSQSRAVSQIRQDANNIESRVTNTEGSAASSKQWIDENSANIQDVVSWKSDNGESLVTFMQTADENYASASQVAKIVDKDGNIIESSIVAAVNNNASSISLSADSIEFTGQKLNIKVDATNIDGTLVIGQLPETIAETSDIPTKTSDLTNDSGFQNETGVITIAKGAITADFIKTLNLEVGNQITMGSNATITWENVNNKPDIPSEVTMKDITRTVITSESIEAPYLKVDAANITGTLTVKNSNDYTLLEAGGNVVKIGDFTVGRDSTRSYIYNAKTTYDDTNNGIYLGTDGIGLGNKTFYVSSDGSLHANTGDIAGWGIYEDGFLKRDYDASTSIGLFSTTFYQNVAICVGGDPNDNIVETAPFKVYHDGSFISTRGEVAGWKVVPNDEIPDGSPFKHVVQGAFYNIYGKMLTDTESSSWGITRGAGYYIFQTYLTGAGVVVKASLSNEDFSVIGTEINTISISWAEILCSLGKTFG